MDIATTYHNTGYVLSRKRKDDEALVDFYKKSLEIRIKVLGETQETVKLTATAWHIFMIQESL